MSNAGARGPSPPKPPAAPPAARPVSPPAPAVAARGVAPARVNAPVAPAPAARTIAHGGQAAQRPPPAPPPGVDDSWGNDEPEDEQTSVAEHAPTPIAPPVQALAAAAAPTPRAPNSAPALASLTAEDLRTIVREMINQAVLPLQHRLAELERRPRAPSAPAFIVQQPAAPAAAVHAPAPAPAAIPAAPASAPAPMYASAMAAPAHAAPAARPLVSAVPQPQVDLAALARDMPMDFDIPFDGRKRKRRMVLMVLFFFLALGGGMAYLLVDSYAHHVT